MRKSLVYGVAFCFVAIGGIANAQSARLTLERVFSDPAISGPNALDAKLSPDGELMTYLKPKEENVMVQDLWGVKTKGGEPFLILDADKLSNSNKELSEAEKSRRERMRLSARGVVDYKWDEGSKAILVPLDGDIFSVSADDFKVSRLTNTFEDEIDAKLSPNGKMLGFVRNGQLILKDLIANIEHEFSPRASNNVSYAIADFIAEEEQDRHTGFWFSPDNRNIAFTKVDETNVDIIPRFEISAAGTKIVAQKYPRAGRPNAIVELYVKQIGQSDMVKIDLGENSDIYLARVNWSLDGKRLFVERQSRDQKTLDLMVFDPLTGKGTVILRDKSDTWVELHDNFRELKSGDFIYSSERDGNNHIYLYDKNGKLKRQITKGGFVVKSILAIDEAADLIYFESSYNNPIENGLYVTSLKKQGIVRPITKNGGWWSINMAKSGRSFVGKYSDPNTPPNAALYDNKGKRLRFIEENALNQSHPYYAFKDTYLPPEFGIIKSEDGQDLHYSMLKPLNFDASRKYPVITYIYGGPAKAMVTKSWVAPNLRLLQDAGFIVFTIDNRGTPQRNTKFTRAIYKKFGGPDIDDQILGAKYLQTLPFVDAKNIGIYGWSQGGFVTLMAMSVKDTPFKAGIAGAPPTEWSLYDTAYTERYMSTPDDNKKGYAASDVLNRLDNIRPNSLFLMHGMADDNVLLDNTTRVAAALQARSIPFEIMLYPGERHGIKGNAKKKHQWQLVIDYFNRKLK